MQWEVNADDPRGYDMVLMDDWESQIVFDSYNPSVLPLRSSAPFYIGHEVDKG
jgi:hypothetical protein